MKRLLVIMILILGLSMTLTHSVQAMAQISLQNNTRFWLKLYIDGNFGCGPVMPSGFCTSSVTAGSHLLEAKKGDELISYERDVNIGDGTSPTWTVTIEEPPTLEGKWMIKSAAMKSLIGQYWTFTRNGNNYTLSTPTSWWPCHPGEIFTGGPTVFTSSFTADYACLRNMYGTRFEIEAAARQQPTYNMRITLSPDGNTITFAIDSVNIYWHNNGRFSHINVVPFADVTTLVRVSLRQPNKP